MTLSTLLHFLGLLPDANFLSRTVGPVVLALDFLDELLHLDDLPVPLVGSHLGLLDEQLRVGLAVRSTEAVPESGELAVVVVEVQVVHGVASGAVDDGRVGHVFTIVDHDGPDLDEGEERDVGELLQREDEGEEVVGDGLGEAIERVEGVRGERCGHDPLVVRLVQALVEELAVKSAVDPVDTEVGESQEDGELEPVPGVAEDAEDRVGDFGVGGGVVDEAEAAHFGNEEGHCEQGHDGNGLEGLLDLKAHLVLEVFGVFESSLVEDEDVAEGGKSAVNEGAKEPGKESVNCTDVRYECPQRNSPCKDVQADSLPPGVVPVPSAHVCIFTRLNAEVLAGGLKLP